MKSLKEDIAFVGIGGCGTNIAHQFEKLGYTTIHINSSSQDESAIKDAKVICHLKGFNGCAGNRKLAVNALANNLDVIEKIERLDENIIYVCFSSSGGTGSGIAPALIDVLISKTNKTICCIVVLPSKEEDYEFHVNSYKCCQELLNIEGIGSTIILDNNSGNKMYLNNCCAVMLNSFFINNSVSKIGNVDEQEKRTLIGTSGVFMMATIKGDKVTEEKIIKSLSEKNIFAPIQKDNHCEYIAIINSLKKGIDKKLVHNIFGIPRRTFEGFGSNETIIAVSGLSFPFDHLNSIKELAKEMHGIRTEIIKSKPNNKLEDLDFEDEFEPVSSINNKEEFGGTVAPSIQDLLSKYK